MTQVFAVVGAAHLGESPANAGPVGCAGVIGSGTHSVFNVSAPPNKLADQNRHGGGSADTR